MFQCEQLHTAFRVIPIRGYKLIFLNPANEFDLRSENVASPERPHGKQNMSLAYLGRF